MSVINTMLKDLERRGVDGSKQGNDILGGLSANKHPINEPGLTGNVYFISLLSIASILAVIVAAYYLSPYKIVSVAQIAEKNPPANVHQTEDEGLAIDQSILAQKNGTELTQATVNTPPATSQVVVAALNTERNDAVIAVQEEPASADSGHVEAAVSKSEQSSNQKINATGKTDVKKKRQQVEPVVINPAVIKQAAIKQAATKQPVFKTAVEAGQIAKTVSVKKTTVSEADNVEQPGGDTEATAVISMKQREYTPQEKSSQAYTSASSLYKQGSKQQAKLLLKEAITYSPENINAYSLLAVIYLESGRADLATEIIEQSLQKRHDDQALLRLYLQSLVQEKKYKEAITVMEKRLQLAAPDDLGYLAGLYQKQSDHLGAVKLYTQALQLKPSTSLWWMGQGISLEVMQKYEEALQSYQQSINTGQLSRKLAQYAISRMNTIKQLHADQAY